MKSGCSSIAAPTRLTTVRGLRNVFEGALLAITREDACGLYGHLKEKLKQSGDALQSEACALIIRELSRRFGC